MTTWRKIKATSHVTLEFTGVISLDEDDYRDWLGSDDDTPQKVREYLDASPDSRDEALQEIERASGVKTLYDVSVYDAEIESVEFIEPTP